MIIKKKGKSFNKLLSIGQLSKTSEAWLAENYYAGGDDGSRWFSINPTHRLPTEPAWKFVIGMICIKCDVMK